MGRFWIVLGYFWIVFGSFLDRFFAFIFCQSQNLTYCKKINVITKELSFCHKLWFYNRHIFSTGWCKPLIFQTIIIWSKMIHSLKYLRSPTFKCKDIGRKSEFVTKTQFLCKLSRASNLKTFLSINLGPFYDYPKVE